MRRDGGEKEGSGEERGRSGYLWWYEKFELLKTWESSLKDTTSMAS